MIQLEVYYDGWCPLCTEVRTRISRLDWLRRLSWRSIREEGAADRVGVPMALLEQRIYVRYPDGRTAGGVDAVAAIAARVPLLMPLWPALLLSRWLGFGQRVYDYIASRRTIVPVGHCDQTGCSIHGHRGDEGP